LSPLTLDTDRLLIRRFEPGDLPVIHRIMDQTFGDGSQVDDAAALAERREWLEWSILSEKWLAELHQPPYGDRAIVLKAGGALIGSIGYVPLLMPFEQMPGLGGMAQPAADPATAAATAEVGLFWTIDPLHQRRGYASEAARAMIAHAFQSLRLKRMMANTDFTNTASQGVMLKVGMRLARNPWPQPHWLQVIGVLDNPDRAHG
jgi:[ribosomal protein S5]-alanine N-acetyltransferase